MKSILAVAATAFLCASAAFAADAPPAIKDASFKDSEGHRVLRDAIIVDAPVEKVWAAFTTDAGFETWAVPLAHITPGNGGMMESALFPGAKIGDANNVLNRIDVYLPEQLLVIHNEHVPSGGPIDPETYDKVRQMIAFEPVGAGQTKVTQTVIGFGDGVKFDDLYAHLRGGNAQYLSMLAKSFRDGPTDWSKEQ